MTDRSRALPHLLTAIEESLRAAAELTAQLRERSLRAKAGDDWLERVLALLAGDHRGLSSEFRAALASEVERWRAVGERASDPPADPVLELFMALLDLVETAPPATTESPGRDRAAPKRPPRRGMHR